MSVTNTTVGFCPDVVMSIMTKERSNHCLTDNLGTCKMYVAGDARRKHNNKLLC